MSNTLISLNLSLDLSLPNDEDLAEELEGWARKARSVKTQSRIYARRASSEQTLSEILPEDIADGESWHVLSSGDVDALSFASYIVKRHHVEYMAFSTWCMAMPDVEVMGEWLDSGQVNRIDAYVGEIFPGTYGREFKELCKTVAPQGGRVSVFRNHSKVFLIKCADKSFVIQGSANINTNPRCENNVMTCSDELYQHHKRYFDEIRAFNKSDFPDWTPF